MKINDLRKKTKTELIKLERENREELGKLRFDLAVNKVKNVKKAKAIKRSIARILTILSENINDN